MDLHTKRVSEKSGIIMQMNIFVTRSPGSGTHRDNLNTISLLSLRQHSSGRMFDGKPAELIVPADVRFHFLPNMYLRKTA